MLGGLDVAALGRALEAIVERHESLRTVIVLDGRVPQQTTLEPRSLDLPVIDLQSVATAERETALRNMLRDESRRAFDLSADLMLRPTLFRLGPSEHVLLLVLHHIASDAASDRILNRELAELYDAFSTGRESQLPELPVQYADYAMWQRERVQGAVLDELVSYWRTALAAAPERLRLPLDRARPAVQLHRGAHRHFALDGALGAAISDLARSEAVTIFMTLLAAFDVLLYRFTGQEDIVVGSPIAGRNHKELEHLIGFFTNTLVLRNRLRGNPTFRELLAGVRTSTSAAFAHQELPFDKLVESLNIRRDPSYNPFFQVNFRANPGPRALLELPGLATAEAISVDIGYSRFDLALELQIENGELGGYFEYDEALFEQATVDGLAAEFEELVRAITTAPDTRLLKLAHAPKPAPARSASPIPRPNHRPARG